MKPRRLHIARLTLVAIALLHVTVMTALASRALALAPRTSHLAPRTSHLAPRTPAADDSTRTPKTAEPSFADNPFLWWKHRWFPAYNWTGYRMRPYFGASPLYPESFLRTMTPIRYNRVEGLTLGLGIPRLSRITVANTYVFGQLGYAFSLDKARYRAGLERQLTDKNSTSYAVLLGGSIYNNVATNDLWKISDPENSLGAFLFEEDHLDYYDIKGWTGWLTADVGAYTEVTVSYRDDQYRTLDVNTEWSMFGGSIFRANPEIDDGRMHSALLRVDAGRVGGLYSVPQGWTVQAEVELGKGLGGDFDCNRYSADARWYWSPEYWFGMAFRVRGGLATDEAPIQKMFTIGGLGTVRAWPQNSLEGTRFAVSNAEIYFDDVDLLLSRLQLFAFGDLGWAGSRDTSFLSHAETLGAVGFGVGLDQRRLRIEFAVPVGGEGQKEPWLWLRLYPAF